MEKLITSEMFRGRFLKNLPSSFVWKNSPLQMYPLSSMSDYFILPTPLLKINYNFLIYVKEGVFIQQIGIDVIEVKAPAIVCISVGTIASLEKINSKLKGYFILIEEEAMLSLLTKESSLNLFSIFPVLEIDNYNNKWIYNLCALLHDELNREIYDNEISNSLLKALLHKILILSDKQIVMNRTQQIAIQFKKLVYYHFKEEKNTLFYAHKLSISENYLNRCVKQVFNKNAKELILSITILNSQILLWDLTKSISEISFEINFDDASYFSRLFKKFTGKSPSEFRKNIMHDLS